MKTQVDLEKCAGKTIEYAEIGGIYNSVLVSFTDGTFACVKAMGCSDGDIFLGDEKVCLVSDDRYTLIKSGIASADEIDSKRAEYEQSRKAEREASELEEFNRLKAKFEAKLKSGT